MCASEAQQRFGSLRLGQRPLAGGVPNLVARQPAPGGLYREDAGELARVPAARLPRAPLAPQAQRLALEHVRTGFERRHHPSLRRRDRISAQQTRLQLVDVVRRLETIREREAAPLLDDANLEFRVASLVVALDNGD